MLDGQTLRGRCNSEEERAELETVLDAPVFRKTPNQSRILRYLCEKRMGGDMEPVKEYQIAVDVLGRSEDYDQREKSTVRVEVYRLRKKLKQYYEQEGSDHAVRIVIEPGQYAAHFVRAADFANLPALSDSLEGEDLDIAGQEGSPAGPPAAKSSRLNRRGIMVLLGAALLLAGGALLWWKHLLLHEAATRPPLPAQAVPAIAASDEIRILAGYPRDNYIDSLGRVWLGDRYFSGGQAVVAPRRIIARTFDPTLFRNYRRGNFTYALPARPGIYELRLHFARATAAWTLEEKPSSYMVRISINGVFQGLRKNTVVDPAGEVVADERVFRNVSPASDGKVHIGFVNSSDYAFVNAIELLRDTSTKIRPFRMTNQPSYYTDSRGLLWQPDRWFSGGAMVVRREPVEGTTDPDLYGGERYGAFSYLIPVAAGRYGLTLWFSETWFGPGMPGGNGVGSRTFSVRCNRATLLHDFDVFREAGGARRVISRTFHGLSPSPEGKLFLEFQQERGDAVVNAIEVLDETE
jgi:hypothetical protein